MTFAKFGSLLSDIKTVLNSPNGIAMLGLGFGSGLPYPLIGSTLGFWLSEISTPLAVIGLFSWAMLPYSLKILWARYLDTKKPFFFQHTNRRRTGWIILAQVLVMISLGGLMIAGYFKNVTMMACFCFIAAFAGASQDISVDAFRIESAMAFSNPSEALTYYQFGYRIALLLSDGIVFLLATHIGWLEAYASMTILMLLPILAAYKAMEPLLTPLSKQSKPDDKVATTQKSVDLEPSQTGPSKWAWVLIFSVVAFYRMPDVIIYPMINPLYHDVGISKDFLAIIHLGVGVTSSFFGIVVAGASALRLGLVKTMKVGAMLQFIAVLTFAILAFSNGNRTVAVLSGSFENIASSFTGVALVLYMSQFISARHAASQYAALTCIYSLFGKLLSGLSGLAIAHLGDSGGRLEAYGVFFLFAGLTSLPAIALLSLMPRKYVDATTQELVAAS
jgi:PAT family beta-lactamase induction signal transducer AmpG